MTKFLFFFIFLTTGIFAQENNRIIIKLKNDVKLSTDGITGILAVDDVCREHKIIKADKLDMGKRSVEKAYVLSFPINSDLPLIIRELSQLDSVDYVELDAIGHGGGQMLTVPNDSYYYAQWGLKNNGTFNLSPAVAGADIKMEQAWDIETGDSDIIVAVMDSGLKLDHPEFAGRLWINTGEIPNNGVDDDLNGYIDDINGWDFAYGDNIPADDYGHGTNVTGIIAANGNNNLGYTGVDMACKIMTLKGLDATNYGYYSWWNNAIRYAADNGADVINLSVGGNTFSALLLGATNYAIAQGTTVVVSMGNGNNNIPTYPAANLNVIAVGSTNPDDTRTAPFFWDVNSGSNFGPHISVVAPGNYIYGLSHTSNTNYGTYWGGTSQAAPLVTGLACLLKAQDPSRTPAQIRTIIRNTADDQVGNLLEDTPGFDMYYGYGRINAFKALSVALSTDKFETEDNLVKIYPNPSSGVFTVQTTSNADIVVYNALGQRIFAKAISPSDNKITIEQEGIYFVTANCNGNKTAAKLVVE